MIINDENFEALPLPQRTIDDLCAVYEMRDEKYKNKQNLDELIEGKKLNLNGLVSNESKYTIRHLRIENSLNDRLVNYCNENELMINDYLNYLIMKDLVGDD